MFCAAFSDLLINAMKTLRRSIRAAYSAAKKIRDVKIQCKKIRMHMMHVLALLKRSYPSIKNAENRVVKQIVWNKDRDKDLLAFEANLK